jgi:surface antigen
VIKYPVLGFLLTLTLVISGCASDPYYGQMSTADNYSTPRNLASYVLNLGKHNAYSVPQEGRERHEQCVYFALDNLNIGEECEWATKYAYGHVNVAAHYPAGSGYCTVLINSVRYKGKDATWKDTACVQGTSNNWKFIKG